MMRQAVQPKTHPKQAECLVCRNLPHRKGSAHQSSVPVDVALLKGSRSQISFLNYIPNNFRPRMILSEANVVVDIEFGVVGYETKSDPDDCVRSLGPHNALV